MPKRLRIIAFASWYPQPANPRLGNFVRRHIEAIAEQHQVVVISAFEGSGTQIHIIQEKSFKEVAVEFPKKLPLYSYLKALQRGFRKVLEQDSEFDLCHIHVAYPAGLMAFKTRLPYVITEHFSGYQPGVKFKWSLMQKKLSQRIIRKAKHLTPVTSQLGEAMNQFAKTNIDITPIANVVDTKVFKPLKRPPNPVFTFLHISTLEEKSKNITGILKGFKKLADQKRNFKLKIGGDGDLTELEKKIEQVGLSRQKVEIIPPSPSKIIAELMKQADALVMFSHYENQPCTILESLCCGTPVVSSNVGGIADVLHPGNGILVEAENEAKFLSALSRMMDEQEQFDRLQIAKEAEARFSPGAILDQFNKVYASVLS